MSANSYSPASFQCWSRAPVLGCCALSCGYFSGRSARIRWLVLSSSSLSTIVIVCVSTAILPRSNLVAALNIHEFGVSSIAERFDYRLLIDPVNNRFFQTGLILFCADVGDEDSWHRDRDPVPRIIYNPAPICNAEDCRSDPEQVS